MLALFGHRRGREWTRRSLGKANLDQSKEEFENGSTFSENKKQNVFTTDPLLGVAQLARNHRRGSCFQILPVTGVKS